MPIQNTFAMGQMGGVQGQHQLDRNKTPGVSNMPNFVGMGKSLSDSFLKAKEMEAQSGKHKLAGLAMMGDQGAAQRLGQVDPEMLMGIEKQKVMKQKHQQDQQKAVQMQRIRNEGEIGIRLGNADPNNYGRIIQHAMQMSQNDPQMLMTLQKIQGLSGTPEGDEQIKNLAAKMQEKAERFGAITPDIETLNKRRIAEKGMSLLKTEVSEDGENIIILHDRYSGKEVRRYTAPIKASPADNKLFNDLILEDSTAIKTNHDIDKLTAYLGDPKKAWDSGLWGKGTNFVKTLTGNTDLQTYFRSVFDSIRNSKAIANLPRGPASEKDIAMVLRGEIPDMSNRETVLEWLNAAKRLEGLLGQKRDFMSNFIGTNDRSSRARKDYTYNGMTIKKGEVLGNAYSRYADSIELEKAGAPADMVDQYREIRKKHGNNIISGTEFISQIVTATFNDYKTRNKNASEKDAYSAAITKLSEYADSLGLTDDQIWKIKEVEDLYRDADKIANPQSKKGK